MQVLMASCTAASAMLYRDDGTTVRYSFNLPPMPDDAPIDPDALPSELPQVETDLPDVVDDYGRHRARLADIADNSLDPARMSAEEREALLSAEVQHDSQAVVDCVIRFGYWRDNYGRMHEGTTLGWGLWAILELPARQAYSRLPVVTVDREQPDNRPLPVSDGEITYRNYRGVAGMIDAVNRYLNDDYRIAPRPFDRPVVNDSHLDCVIQHIAEFLLDVAAVQAIDRELRETIGAA
jgi:hypothetical protein